MIYRHEILDGRICPEELEDNLLELLIKINKVRDAWGKPMTVTSGLRSKQDQVRIYAQKGITDLALIPMASKHLSAQAIDIYDPQGELHAWCLKSEKLLVEIGLWLEVRQGPWQHFQTKAFSSYKVGGTIWFNP